MKTELPALETHFLTIDKCIVFFDLETTGLSIKNDRIVELYAVKVFCDGKQEEMHYFINPTIPIPEAASAVHGITDEQVKDQPRFCDIAEELFDFFKECDIAGYNAKQYDIPLLIEEFHRCKMYPLKATETKIIDAKAIFFNKEKRDLASAVKFYCGEEHTDAHSAKADVLATINVLKHQLLRYDDLEPNTSFLHDFVTAEKTLDFSGMFLRNENGDIIFNIGKNKGKLVSSDPGYLRWITDKSDFPIDTQVNAQRILRNLDYQKQIRNWLAQNNILQDITLASALFTTVKYKESIKPFVLVQQNISTEVIYDSKTDYPLLLKNEDAVGILLRELETTIQMLQSTAI
jgi:DNA polymerase III subunit epsilon